MPCLREKSKPSSNDRRRPPLWNTALRILWNWLENIFMPPPGEICVKVLGVVGTGEDAITGQWSDETCIVRQPDTTTSVGRFQQAATRAAEQLKKAGILPGQGATKVKTGPAWPALYLGVF